MTASKGQSKQSLFQRAGPIILVVAGLILFFALDLQRYFTLDTLRDNRDALKDWVAASPLLAMLIFVAAYAAAVAISFPGASILTVFGGFLFGLWPGVPLVIVAATLGASAIFFASKSAFADMLSERAGGFVKSMEKGFHEDELNYMFVLRLAPIFPFWAINIAAGLLGVKFRNFFIGTFFGIIPGSFVYTSIGNAANSAFDTGEDVSLSGILFQPATLIPIIGLVVLALIPVIMKRLNKSAVRELSSDE